MTFSNVYLSTNPGFVYNIGLTYNASKLVDYSNVNIASDESTTIINNSTFSLVANIQDNYVLRTLNITCLFVILFGLYASFVPVLFSK